ncbi:iron-containing alcohol dehydrogenase [Bordetella flabilis]|uniref:Alcohol dehydrogenase n=1 Tax=Bordetella flabilis TaxID=463014 RepID=A0A193GE01_9BORD|nr:iron-containing alcohol dehydrogenase [Bordetella flabilis]ANN77843.1 alcohol dehydrogenase [Bordetella flabilis]
MNLTEFRSVPEILFGAGLARRLGDVLARRCKGRRVFVATDAGFHGTGLLRQPLDSLGEAGFTVTLFTGVVADPPTEVVQHAVRCCRDADCDVVLGVGGGSSMDVAKLVAALALTGQDISDAYGIDRLAGPRLPLMQMPTTAGTGSEATPVAIVTTGAQSKMGVVSPLLLCDIALLDPSLTLGLPAGVTAATGVDAMVHAVEAYTSRLRKNPLSDQAAREALRLLGRAIERACEDGADLHARSDMLLGAMLAGQAFANAPVAAVHALAYPVGALFHIPHGVSNALMLGPVLRFNAEAAARPYAELAALLIPNAIGSDTDRALALADYFEALITRLKLPVHLSDVGISAADLPTLAEQAMQQQRLLVNNPRTVELADALALYQRAY